jgi:hypothetical protein
MQLLSPAFAKAAAGRPARETLARRSLAEEG